MQDVCPLLKDGFCIDNVVDHAGSTQKTEEKDSGGKWLARKLTASLFVSVNISFAKFTLWKGIYTWTFFCVTDHPHTRFLLCNSIISSVCSGGTPLFCLKLYFAIISSVPPRPTPERNYTKILCKVVVRTNKITTYLLLKENQRDEKNKKIAEIWAVRRKGAIWCSIYHTIFQEGFKGDFNPSIKRTLAPFFF